MDKETKAILSHILTVVEATRAEVRRVDAKVDAVTADVAVIMADVAVMKVDISGLKTDVSELKTDVSELKSGQRAIIDHLDVAELKGRVEEQSRAIAQLIPTRVAAVPGR